MRGYARNGYRSHSRYATASDGSSKRQGSYNRKSYYSKKPQNKDKGVTFCPHYTIKGSCRYINDCKNLHNLKLVDTFTLQRSYIDCAIIVHGPNNEIYLFASASPYTINVWMFVPGEDSKEIDIKHLKKIEFQLTEEEEYYGDNKLKHNKKSNNKKKRVLSLLYAEECIFAGLDNGIIKIMHLPSSDCSTLYAHTDAIHSIVCIDGIIISSSINGEVKFWKYDETHLSFVTIKKIETKTKINKMIEIVSSKCLNNVNNKPNDVNPEESKYNRTLWVCGDSITIINLLNLEIVNSFKCKYGNVVSVIQYEANVITAMSEGKILAYGLSGREYFEMNTLPIYCMAGLTDHKNLPILIYGSNKSLYTFSLPEFNSYGYLKDRDYMSLKFNISDPNFILTLSGPYFIVVFGNAGHAKVWKWETKE
ncbi:zinc finger (CCCH type) protein, putative [Plasmodium chabaudi chabaudi]|uniref:Zinc finger (CCCH type) protein, putative n=2 Tax=Plasmodium chabaudi TaxID=5825 RepID=A0A077TV95_PLACU|nr:zinc finger (CCCH type) protein, putative [Plasmodium chabaudi chabaudi]SCM13269.1 zinc finger (CCCH type) protein, putative [Plasmodium chabaudi adami]SCM24618.1 zinc finger (CCCH type) protein, putative [Plasmodium chabaudi adami]SCM26023.1 zinc finger (CCCH type) protein, putative [Plasmodium chabaudi chabaudi]SCN62780.1 zinc finger (CCCH type) protein, putative [Plasmodium chabaudi chabaudi]VTZ70834.1 zinc finger (CCCH type) protein, putative [Plasmodium chabaudi chabaudi]|eukprot:XP_016654864.1 zinc finger (CCCH type) protein, putative [Plasmodium chabaudi chabaudi]